jgi:lipoprotein NlpI
MISVARKAAIFVLILAAFAIPPQAMPFVHAAQADSGPDAVEINFWDSIKTSTDPADFQAYLKKYPNGYFADLANNRIRKLTPAAPAAAPEAAPAKTAPSAPAATPPAAQTIPPAAPESKPAAQQPTAPAAVPAVVFTSLDQKLYARPNARLRAQPNRNGAVLSRVAANTVLAATGRSADGNWWRIALADGGTGYIAASLVSDRAVSDAKPAAPVAAVPDTPKPTGSDADVCNPSSGAAPHWRADACERAQAAATDKGQRSTFLIYEGLAQDDQRHYDTAISTLQKAADLDPQNFKIYYNIGLVRQHQHQYPQARAAFEKAALVHPDDPDSLFQRGVSVAAMGDFDEGKLDVTRAIGLKDDPGYYGKLAEIEVARANFDGAKTATARALKLDPGYASIGMVMTDYFIGALDQAADQGTRLAGKQPNDYRAALWKSLILRAKGDAAGADQALDAGASGGSWPAPLFAFLQGKISADKLKLAGKSSDPVEQAEHLCQIDFYTGEATFHAGDKETATRALRDAASTRIYYFPEYAAAKARLALQ